jgi:DNA-binding NtrC family response regulator
MPTIEEGPEPACRVLLVEDEGRLRDLLVRAVRDMGFDSQGCRTAEEAVKLMEAGPAPIVVLDLNLPGMSGLEFLEVVHQRWRNTAVVILTGFGDLPAARKAMHLDAVDFLTKPCPLGDLEVALDRARRRSQPQASSLKGPLLTHPPAPDRPAAPAGTAGAPTAEDLAADRTHRLDEVERLHILAALKRHDGNRTATAHELGISLRTLYYRLSEYQKAGLLPAEPE